MELSRCLWIGVLAFGLILANACGSNSNPQNDTVGDVVIGGDSYEVTQREDAAPDQGHNDRGSVDHFNPYQYDDTDADGIPDEFDLFPNDPDKPGTVLDNYVYAHTADELWVMSVKTYSLDFVAFFDFPSDGNFYRMTDIAIDRRGVLYGVSSKVLFVVNTNNGECYKVAELPDAFNALTLVPKGVLDADNDVLVGISGGGDWYRLDRVDGEFVATRLGSYGELYTSSGDAYSIKDVGTFASVNKIEEAADYLIEVDPTTGNAIREVGKLAGLNYVYGLAGWTGRAMAFDENGEIAIVDTTTGDLIKMVTDTPKKWWGAGVRTVLPGD
mgnify:CR=1 FL=1